MKKLAMILAMALAIALLAPMGFTEDQNTERLARVIYAMAGNASYEAKLAVGSVVMNRVADPWFPAALEDVLKEKYQFPAGTRYDEESLYAARAAMAGQRSIPDDLVYIYAEDASYLPEEEPALRVDGYALYPREH